MNKPWLKCLRGGGGGGGGRPFERSKARLLAISVCSDGRFLLFDLPVFDGFRSVRAMRLPKLWAMLCE